MLAVRGLSLSELIPDKLLFYFFGEVCRLVGWYVFLHSFQSIMPFII